MLIGKAAAATRYTDLIATFSRADFTRFCNLSTPTLIDSNRFKTSYTHPKFEIGPMSTEPWVNVEQVAQHLNVAKDTIYRWREHRGLPAHRIGRLWKFKLSEVDDWVRAGGADDVTRNAPPHRDA